MKIIIPMAGLGTRFQKVSDQNPEYKKPKPFIMVKGKPMVRWATGSLPFIEHPDQKKNPVKTVKPEDLIFLILKEHDDQHEIEKGLKNIYSDKIRVIKLPHVTRGAAETAHKAKEFVDPDEELIVTDSDHHFNGTILMHAINNKDADTAGVIPVFRARNEGIAKWSYSLIKDGTSIITKVGEKDEELMNLGAPANIGAYYFTKAHYFFDEAEETIKANKLTGESTKAEFYVAPLYQSLIEKGMKVQAAVIPAVWGLGTPGDLEFFLTQDIELE